MPAHHNRPATSRHPEPPAASAARPQRLPVPLSGEPPVVPNGARRLAPRSAAPAPRDLAAAAEPAFVPARGDAAIVTIRDRIAGELVKAHDLSPASLPAGRTPDLEGAEVRVTAARVPAVPLTVKVPFAGVGWTALLQRTEWKGDGRASLVYQLYRSAPGPTEPGRR